MKTLIQKVQEKHDFKWFDKVVIPGHSKILVLNKYQLNVDDEMKLILSEMHCNSETIEDALRLSITEVDDNNLFHVIDFFEFSDEQKLFSFLEFFVK